MGQDRLRPTHPPKSELSQHWKWLLYDCAQLRQLLLLYVKVDMVYAIGVLKCYQEIIFIFRIDALATGVGNSDRKCWPATQKFVNINPFGAVKLDREVEWRGKDELTPSMAYVYESIPFPKAAVRESRLTDSMGIEYLEQYIVWEHVNHCMVYTTIQYSMFNVRCSTTLFDDVPRCCAFPCVMQSLRETAMPSLERRKVKPEDK